MVTGVPEEKRLEDVCKCRFGTLVAHIVSSGLYGGDFGTGLTSLVGSWEPFLTGMCRPGMIQMLIYSRVTY